MDKKLQIFVSSTYVDLENERQIAVKSILESGHIPAGMELFTANSDEQWNIIKRWIDNSDVYLLILGGRYGSIDEKTKISYTEMEYDYAIKTGKPIISIILSEKYLNNINNDEITKHFERRKRKYIDFKKKVKGKMAKIINKCEDIDGAIPKAILEIDNNSDVQLTGWIRGDFSKIDSKFKIGQLSFNELNHSLRKKEFDISEKFQDRFGEKIDGITAYTIIKWLGGSYASAYSNKDCIEQYIYDYICPYFISLGLLERKRAPGRSYVKTQFTKDGIKFNQLQEKFSNK